MEKIVFKDFSVGGGCDLFHHGVTYDCLGGRLTFFEIYAGTLNGIVGEFGEGGAILRNCRKISDADCAGYFFESAVQKTQA